MLEGNNEKGNNPQVYARATACGIGPNSYGAAETKVLKDRLEELMKGYED